ncbi:MAG TPA: acyl carrier protein [Defluviitaleaceae bacterium]|nr:acyl carrier protein [Defluviitaleaceae bacterium]
MNFEEEILEIAKRVLKTDQVDLSTNRENIDEWDSLAHLQIISEVEDKFAISIPFEEVSDIKSLSDFLKYIERSK